MNNRRVAFWNRKSQKETSLTIGTKQKALSFVESMIDQDGNEFIKIGEMDNFCAVNTRAFKNPRLTVTNGGINSIILKCLDSKVRPLEIRIQGLELHKLIALHSYWCTRF